MRRLLPAVASVVLAAGLTAAVPSAPASAAYDNSIGIVKVPDQYRKNNCADYVMRWSFKPPSDQWTVIAKVRSPRYQNVHSQFWDSNSPNNLGKKWGSLKFRMCSASAPAGRYRVDMQMIYDSGFRQTTTVNRAPTYFRLVQR